jgi:hypothetical protein
MRAAKRFSLSEDQAMVEDKPLRAGLAHHGCKKKNAMQRTSESRFHLGPPFARP